MKWFVATPIEMKEKIKKIFIAIRRFIVIKVGRSSGTRTPIAWMKPKCPKPLDDIPD
jgi:hypothetical protein